MASPKTDSRKRNERSIVSSPPAPSFYPIMPGYQFIMPPWGPPPFAGNFQHPWQPPWTSPQPYPHSGGYRPWHPEDMTGGRMPSYYRGESPMTSEEYMLNSLRHIYSNDGSIEIERVKVQKRPFDTVSYATTSRPVSRIMPVEDSDALYASINVTHDGKVPPPRKRKKNRQVAQQKIGPVSSGEMPHQWNPYPPYMPTYPCTFAFGYMPPPMAPYPYSPHHHPFATSPELFRSPSPSDPSDNPSSRGDYEKPEKNANEREHSSSEIGLTDERMSTEETSRPEDSRKQPAAKQLKSKEKDRDYQKNNHPPTATTSKPKSSSKGSKSGIERERRTKSLDKINLSTEQNHTKDNSELVAAFRKLEETADKFKDHARIKVNESTTQDSRTNTDDVRGEITESRESSMSLSSVQHSIETVDSELIENDFTDTTLKDENDSQSEKDQSTSSLEESDLSFQWILKSDDPDITIELEKDERTQPWRTEVSLWRARLIVSLCKGQSFDQQDWETFHLLVQHPLALSMKLSLLNAPRFCHSNTGVGVASLRNALLLFIPYGEMLLREEAERPPTWNIIQLKDSHFWTTVKGSQEILRVFGYIHFREGQLKHSESRSSEASVLARMTLDMLVLAEEFRLYLAGNHLFPANITTLFTQGYVVPNPISRTEESASLKCIDPSLPPVSDSSTSDSTTLQTVIQKNSKDLLEDRVESLALEDDATTKVQIPDNIEVTTAVGEKVTSRDPPSISPVQCIDSIEVTTAVGEKVISRDPQSISPVGSIPDLHSISTAIPPLVSESDETKAELESSAQVGPLDLKEGEELKTSIEEPPRRKAKVVSRDKPEDHIYEEICDLKTQEKESVDAGKAPPIPPKSKRSHFHHDTDYNLAASSICATSNTSAPCPVARKKKRRAPMPPDFTIIQPQDLQGHKREPPSQSEDKGHKREPPSQSEDKVDQLNLDGEKKDSIDSNPFCLQLTPSGFVGKNPFYEDILPPTRTLGVAKINPPSYSSVNKTANTKCTVSSAESASENAIAPQVPMKQLPTKQDSKACDGKNLKEEQQCSSRVVVPISIPVTESANHENENSTNDKIILVKEDCKRIFAPPPITLASYESTTTTPSSSSQQCISSITVILDKKPLEQNQEVKNDKKAHLLGEKSDIQCEMKDNHDGREQSKISDTKLLLPSKKMVKLPPKSRLNLNNKRNDSSIIKIQTAKSDGVETSPIIPPMPPPKAPLKLLDDIPYIDTNEIQEIKHSLFAAKHEDDLDQPPERLPSPPPYSPPIIPNGSPPDTPGTTPPASPVFFLRGSSGTTVIIEDSEKRGENMGVAQRARDEANREQRTVSIFEERYEIPDLSRVESNIKLLNARTFTTPTSTGMRVWNNASPNINNLSNLSPDRPTRKIRPSHPPPRPPKPLESSIPPLPPKITNFHASLWHSSSSLERSTLPSKKASTMNVCKSSPSLMTHKSHTLPSKSSSERNSGDKTSPPVGPRSVSTPSSPKTSDRPQFSNRNPKTGKSWSSVFCDCVYANNSNGYKGQK